MKTTVTYADNLNLSGAEKALIQNRIAELERSFDPHAVLEVNVGLNEDGDIDVSYKAEGERFERIRRITGYLVGTIDRWNNAKRAECFDRRAHDVA